ncbi:MAG: hypothetical protein WA990_13740, partial [Rubrobacteraceae bacterium]
MSGSGWDTRNTGAARRLWGKDRLALLLGVSLLAAVVLVALTGKVLASNNPQALTDSSPTADHIERQAPASSSEPPDPESLFLDLPDPPPVPKASTRNPSSGSSARPGRSPGTRASQARVRGASGRAGSAERAAGRRGAGA